jgi:hypothetical protein
MNRILILRSSTAGARPVGRDTGELYVNLPDNQLGVIDDTNAPVDLIAVRHFSPAASYFTGDCVFYNGKIYIATGIFGPGTFNPLDWNVVTMATDLALYMPLSGGTFTGVVRFPANNSVVINGAVATQRAILGQTAGSNRWQLMLGDFTAESGLNAGSNFSLSAMTDGGATLSTPLAINRATGVADFAVTPTVAGVPIGGGAGGATVSDTAPLNPSEGDLWWDSVGAQMYVWYVDATSSQWVPVISNAGPPGPIGPIGPVGPQGPIGASSGWTQIATQVVAVGAQVIFTGLSQAFSDLMIVGAGVNKAAIGQVYLQVSTDNGVTYSTPGNMSVVYGANPGPTSWVATFHGYSADFGMMISGGLAVAMPASPAAVGTVPNAAAGAFQAGITVHTGGCNTLRFSPQSGNFTGGGTITIYGR